MSPVPLPLPPSDFGGPASDVSPTSPVTSPIRRPITPINQYPYPYPSYPPAPPNPLPTAPATAQAAGPAPTSSRTPATVAIASVHAPAPAPAPAPIPVAPSSQEAAFFVPASDTSATAQTPLGTSTASSATFTTFTTTTPSTSPNVAAPTTPTIQTFNNNNNNHPLTSKFSTLVVPSPGTSTALPSSPSPTPPVSTLALTFITLGAFSAIGLSVFLFRYFNRRRRHADRLARRGPASDDDNDGFPSASEKDEKYRADESPVFGGRERSGMTPLPSSNVRYSWTTFPDHAPAGVPSATVLGLAPSFNIHSPGPYTVANHMFLPSRNAPPNPSTSTSITLPPPAPYTRSSSAGSISDSEIPHAVITTAARRSFKPPRIMVTSTSPKSSVGADADPHTGFLPPSDSEESASETEFRLVAPPRLAVVNVPERDNAVGGVGVQLGLRMHMQRPNQPPTASNIAPALPRSPLSQRSPSSSPHVKGSPRTPGRNPGTKTQLLYDVPRLPATEPETVNPTHVHTNTGSSIPAPYPLLSQQQPTRLAQGPAATDSLLLSPATAVGSAMLAEWGAPTPAPVLAPALQTQDLPPLPPVGQPSLRQLALMHEMPDYRSPTYSIYGMYSGSADASAGAGPGGKRHTQTLVTPGSAYGGLAATGVGDAVGQRNGGAVPGTGLFGRIL